MHSPRAGRRRILRPGIGAVVFLCLVALITAPSAGAQGEAFLLIRKIDSSKPDDQDKADLPKDATVDFFWTGSSGDLAGAKVQLNGADVALKAPPAPNTAPRGIAIIIDSSPQMDDQAGLANAREAAKKLITDSPATTQFAIIHAGDQAKMKVDFTSASNQSTLFNAIEPPPPATSGIGRTNGTAIWAALNIAGSAFYDPDSRGHDLQPNVILITGGADAVSPADEPLGRTAILRSGAALFIVERTDMGTDFSSINDLATRAGGQVVTAENAGKIGALVAQVGDVINNKQFTVSYATDLLGQQPADIVLTVASQSTKASILIGGVSQGGQQIRPEVITATSSLEFLSTKAAYIIALLLALTAVALLAYGVTSMFVRDDLSNVLQPYADSYGSDGFDDEGGSAFSKSALIQRAVELTEQVAQNQGMLSRAEGALERANLPLRAGEALFGYSVFVALLTLGGLIFFKNVFGGLVLGILGAMIPVTAVNFVAKRRRKHFMSQLPDTLQLLSGTLRAGYSLMQGVEAVSQEVDDPMGLELRRVVTEARLGRPLEESLEASAERMDSPDFAWAVMAIRIQREVGGNLSELLMTVADTMVARERLRRDVAALTAEGRVSAVVLGALPAGLGMMMYALNPDYVGVLFKETLGIIMLIAAGFGMGVGFLWMKKIINIEI